MEGMDHIVINSCVETYVFNNKVKDEHFGKRKMKFTQ